MTGQTLAISYALAVGTACPLAFGLGKVIMALLTLNWRGFPYCLQAGIAILYTISSLVCFESDCPRQDIRISTLEMPRSSAS